MVSKESVHKAYFELPLDEQLELITIAPRRHVPGNSSTKRFATLPATLPAGGEEKEGAKLCVILAWFTAQKRHLMKFAQLYLDQGFDVLLGKNSPVHAYKPEVSAKKSATKTLDFFTSNSHYSTIVIHGFSIGAMWWGQTLRYINRHPDLYGFLHHKIKGQVWDSPFTDENHLPYVASSTVFPKNASYQKFMEGYLKFHMRTLNVMGSKPCEKVFHEFKHVNFNTPYLLFTSEDDSAALCSTVAACAERWKVNGNKVYWKIWSSSAHVCHMKEHPEEYKALLWDFLTKIGVCDGPIHWLGKSINAEIQGAMSEPKTNLGSIFKALLNKMSHGIFTCSEEYVI